MIIVGIALLMLSLLCSSELFRRGVYADDDEIMERHDANDTGCGLIVLMLVLGIAAMFVLAAGGIAIGM